MVPRPQESKIPAAHEATVIVCTHDRPNELERCLSSLEQLQSPPAELIVVNSAGKASVREIANAHGARYLETGVPGVSFARNLGAAAARSEWIAYLDDDSVAEPGWLSALLAPFKQENVAAVFGAIEPLKSAIAYSEAELARPRLPYLDCSISGWFWMANTGRISLGGNMAFRRTALAKCGGFDTRMGRGSIIPGAEEHRLCSQLIGSGYRGVLAPDAVVRHPSPSNEAELRRFKLEMIEIAAAHLVLLAFECPEHRMELLREASRRMLRSPSHNRARGVTHSSISFMQRLRAVARGLRRCWQARSGRRSAGL